MYDQYGSSRTTKKSDPAPSRPSTFDQFKRRETNRGLVSKPSKSVSLGGFEPDPAQRSSRGLGSKPTFNFGTDDSSGADNNPNRDEYESKGVIAKLYDRAVATFRNFGADEPEDVIVDGQRVYQGPLFRGYDPTARIGNFGADNNPNRDRRAVMPDSTMNMFGVNTDNPRLNMFGVERKSFRNPTTQPIPPVLPESPANMDPMTRTLSQAMIPQAPPVMVDYEVGSFRDTENLMTIVEDLNRDGVDITLEELAKANDLPVNPDGSPVDPFVQKGEVIKVPVQSGIAPPTEFMDKETKAMLQETTPIKASYTLADQLANATRALKKITGLGDTGQTIYEVKANDTLSKIARQKGVTLSDIKLANPDIDYDTIRVGQEINIPRNGTIERIEQAETTEQVINTVANSMPVIDNPLDFIFRQGLIGLDENNPAHQNSIKGFLNNAVPNFVRDKSQVTSSKKAWCGAFVDHVLNNLGLDSLNTNDKYDKLIAKKYLKYGDKVDIKDAKPGDLVIVKNPDGFHVTFLTSISRDGSTLNGLGGNQSNSVKVSQYESSQIQGIRRIGDIKNVDTETIKSLTVDIAEGESTTR